MTTRLERAGLAVLLASLAPLVPLAALAHGDPIGGLAPLLDEAGRVVGAGTTWGVVLRDGDGWLRSCEEGPGAPPRLYHRASDGRVLVGGDAGLASTRDGGCTYEPVEGALLGHQIAALAVAGGAPSTMFAGTATPDRDNGVFVSRDEGRTFEATPLVAPGLRVGAIVVSDDGQRVLVAAQDVDTANVRVFTSSDSGASFAPDPPALLGYDFVRLLGTASDGETFAAAVATGSGNALLLSADGFASSAEVGSFDDEVTAYGEVAGARFVTLSRTRLFRQAASGEPFVLVTGPSRCLLRVPGDDRLWGCGQLPDGAHLLASSDGETWEPHVPFLGVEERLCPEGTAGRERCERYLFPDAGPGRQDAGAKADAGSPRGDPPDCGCATTRESREWSWLLAALVVGLTARSGCRSSLAGARSPRRRGAGSGR